MARTAVFCPGVDQEMREAIEKMVTAKWVLQKDVHDGKGSTKSLKQVDKETTLFIMSHGNPIFPVFQTRLGKWTGPEMAKLLEKNSLRKNHREIVLLVCNAGSSLSDEANFQRRSPMIKELQMLERKDKVQFEDKLVLWNKEKKDLKQFDSNVKGSLETRILPLAAQLVAELKSLKFLNIRVTCYRTPVSQNFLPIKGDETFRITLDTKGFEGKNFKERESDPAIVEKYKVIWQ
ncbi:hypothetical protein SAMN05421819_1723 [Bryocella elongata]|uniref:Uncharacterized protein n=1 Tax=Bryocella elongata TaxID=863522 RepID=A0A1H5WSK6_9BACT|nr:hypothetical protein [Bryocella elongata]SEG02378.1 hypothetical protein SAMN05421819_1723 [Bryocella elongata]